ncbi:MAG: hypothetical protein ACLSAP_12425 [Oscillospiraceae bacterium]
MGPAKAYTTAPFHSLFDTDAVFSALFKPIEASVQTDGENQNRSKTTLPSLRRGKAPFHRQVDRWTADSPCIPIGTGCARKQPNTGMFRMHLFPHVNAPPPFFDKSNETKNACLSPAKTQKAVTNYRNFSRCHDSFCSFSDHNAFYSSI